MSSYQDGTEENVETTKVTIEKESPDGKKSSCQKMVVEKEETVKEKIDCDGKKSSLDGYFHFNRIIG
ncbi:hypothetical protein COLO4_00070 [Corchorus olitorius]|uniref:Uncharacterized protein n=1 Tax=Corchorus olitorius TaxID=93759 RepID=A0A1R3L4R0_9ROSI|nr:hypothetical protein COLO4_00070 [Corchorus olitorius]